MAGTTTNPYRVFASSDEDEPEEEELQEEEEENKEEQQRPPQDTEVLRGDHSVITLPPVQLELIHVVEPELHIPPTPHPLHIPNFKFQQGLERPQFHTSSTGPFRRSSNYTQRNITFHGSCYVCGCAGHSSRFCPLKFCTMCRTFGHSSGSCPKNQNKQKYASQ